jgi:hypothetical protein
MPCLPRELPDRLRCRRCGRLVTDVRQCEYRSGKRSRRHQADVGPGLFAANGYDPGPSYRSPVGIETWQGSCFFCNSRYVWRLVHNPRPAVQLVDEKPLRRPPKASPGPFLPGLDPGEANRAPRQQK